jgi:RNA polymerase sigma factor (sigma-70 family)
LGHSDNGSAFHSAWTEFCELYVPLIQAWCGRWNINGQDADDVTQEVLISIRNSIRTFDRHRPFRHWLKSVTRNTLINYAKKNKKPGRAGAGGSENRELLDEQVDDFDETVGAQLERDEEVINVMLQLQ